MPKLLDLDVSIEMDGERLPEYDLQVVETDGIPVATFWIPSQAGKNFVVKTVVPPPPRQCHHTLSLRLDGVSITVYSNILRKHETGPIAVQNQVVGPAERRAFGFAILELTDDDEALGNSIETLGEIEVSLHSVDEYVDNPEYQAPKPPPSSSKVHEKSKKAMAHCVSFGATEESPAPRWFKPINTKVVAKYKFKYRSIDFLVAQGIAPRTVLPTPPTPESLSPPPANPSTTTNIPSTSPGAGPSNPKKRKAEPTVKVEIDLEEELRLEDEEKELRARLAAIEARRSQNNPAKRVKTEVKAEAGPFFLPGEVIDLTDD